MSSVSLAKERLGFDEEGGAVELMASPDHTLPPAPPPAPPLPAVNSTERKRKVKGFYWNPIPEDLIKQQDRPNLWSQQSGETAIHIDIRAIEELFGQQEDSPSSTASIRAIRRGRASVRDLKQQISILDSKRSLNISIFLKHFRKSSECLLDDVLHINTGVFSVESLRELMKLLPVDNEVKNLQMFSGNLTDLAPPDAFIHQLIHLPRYEVRLQALLLKEEFFPTCTVMKNEISTLLTAIKGDLLTLSVSEHCPDVYKVYIHIHLYFTELLSCEELHNILRLVLQAGNIMNAGGSAGNAMGFKLSSLLSLVDTKANKPGVNLLHFVALEAQKKDLLMFPEKLLHVQRAERVCVDSIHAELHSLSRRVDQLQQIIQTDEELLTQLQSFLESAVEALQGLTVSIDELQREGHALIDFFCEDKDTFKLDECLKIFQNFCSKFRKAVQENVERGMWEESRRRHLKELGDKRHSWAGHDVMGGAYDLRSNSEADVEAAFEKEGLLELLHSPLLRLRNTRRPKLQKNPSSGEEAHILPPIHSLSIADDSDPNTTRPAAYSEASECDNSTMIEEPVDLQETLSIGDLQTPRHTELSPTGVTSEDPSESTSRDGDHVQLTPQPAVNSTTAIKQSKQPAGSKTRQSPSAKSPASESETASLRKVVPLRQSKRLSRNMKTQALQTTPGEKICRTTITAAPRNSSNDSTPPNFIRNTIASATRSAVDAGKWASAPKSSLVKRTTLLKLPPCQNQQKKTALQALPTGHQRNSSNTVNPANESSALKVSPLTRTAPLRLSRSQNQQKTALLASPTGHQRNSSYAVNPANESSAPKVSPLTHTASLRLSHSQSQQKTALLTPPTGHQRKNSSAVYPVNPSLVSKKSPLTRTASLRLSRCQNQQKTALPMPPTGHQKNSSNAVNPANESSAPKVSPLTHTASLRLSRSQNQQKTALPMTPTGHQRKNSSAVDAVNQSLVPKKSPLTRTASLRLSRSQSQQKTTLLTSPTGHQRNSSNTVNPENESSTHSVPIDTHSFIKTFTHSKSAENSTSDAPYWTPVEQQQCNAVNPANES